MNDEQNSGVHHSSFIIHRLFPIRAIFPPLLDADTGFPLCYGPAPFLDRPPLHGGFSMSYLCCLIGVLWPITTPFPLNGEYNSGPAPDLSYLDKPISCCFKDVSLQEACEWFEYLMGVKINIDEAAMSQARSEEGRHLALEEENVPFQEVLEKLLKPIGVTYEVTEKGIQITREPVSVEDKDVPYSE